VSAFLQAIAGNEKKKREKTLCIDFGIFLSPQVIFFLF
jgi:hypothetical protein